MTATSMDPSGSGWQSVFVIARCIILNGKAWKENNKGQQRMYQE